MSETAAEIDLGYRPRDWAWPFHQRTQRWSSLVLHRRAGKSVACVMDLVAAALECTKPQGRFAYIAPTYTQSKDIAWAYLKRFTAPIPGAEQRESDLMVVLPNGARVRLYGADNYDRLRGGYADGIVLDEYQLIDPRAWPEVIRPMLADREGWAVFCGTPAGRNDLYRVHREAQDNPAWFSLVLRSSESGIIQPPEMADIRATLTEEQYAQEMECSFEAAIRGAIYRRELDECRTAGRICAVPYDPSVPVWTAWDLGMDDATALWCAQTVGREVHVIDYYEATGEPITHYFDWLSSRRYRYGTDLLPHDAKARSLGTGKSIEELARANGRNVTIVPRLEVEDGINAVRLLLPRVWFDAKRCERGLEALTFYRREFNDRMGVYKPAPIHDWSSHGSDSFRYLAVGLNERPGQYGKIDLKPKLRLLNMGRNNDAWMGL